MKIKVWVEFGACRHEVDTSIPEHLIKGKSERELDDAIRAYAITVRDNIMDFGFEYVE